MLRISDIVRRKEFSILSGMEKTMTLNHQEEKRMKVCKQHLKEELSIVHVAAVLTCMVRHVYRLKKNKR